MTAQGCIARTALGSIGLAAEPAWSAMRPVERVGDKAKRGNPAAAPVRSAAPFLRVSRAARFSLRRSRLEELDRIIIQNDATLTPADEVLDPARRV
jgi:hypothetical protein